jgi:CDK inhibitor PHO81
LNIITPFSGVTLEVGGAVETYWKSTAIPATDLPRPWSVSTMPVPQESSGSTSTPPPTQPAVKRNRSLTISSIRGDYLYVVVQVTQDMQPVAYPDWKLPGDKFDLYVPNLTLSQFNKLAVELGRKVDTRKHKPSTPAQWYSLLRGSMLSLAEVLSVSNLAVKWESNC